LLLRGAMVGFTGLFSAPELFALARRDDVESRLVVRDGAYWSLAHGPFRRADFKSLPARHWTLLVQGVNLVDPAGDALLRRFSFLPFARPVRPSSPPPSSTSCATSSTCPDATPIPISRRSARPPRSVPRCGDAARNCWRALSGTRRRLRVSSAAGFRNRNRRSSSFRLAQR
jgi:hypothetical protein